MSRASGCVAVSSAGREDSERQGEGERQGESGGVHARKSSDLSRSHSCLPPEVSRDPPQPVCAIAYNRARRYAIPGPRGSIGAAAALLKPSPSGLAATVLTPLSGLTQEALYRDIDQELSWSEAELPQQQRTKHVHSLHPYLGKFIPQIVEVFLRRYFEPGGCVYDPFAGSGTTLVEANVFGAAAIGCDISAFNCLLSEVKTGAHQLDSLELALSETLAEAIASPPDSEASPSGWLRSWYAPGALNELMAYRAALEQLDAPHRKVAKLILSRAARSARKTTHYDLDFPKTPIHEPYWCHKHKRTCRPVEQADKFLRRYTLDTVRRLRDFGLVRTEHDVVVLHQDARTVKLPLRPSGIITSPPYPGLIDYHEQHRYSYELLGLLDRREEEIGPAVRGRGKAAAAGYSDSMVEVLRNARGQLPLGAPIVIVVNDSKDLYPKILDRAGIELIERLTRHVNRRTGRRAGEFFEEVLVCRVGRA